MIKLFLATTVTVYLSLTDMFEEFGIAYATGSSLLSPIVPSYVSSVDVQRMLVLKVAFVLTSVTANFIGSFWSSVRTLIFMKTS